MSDKGFVDEVGLELIETRLEIDIDRLSNYLVANSRFPEGTARVKQFNKGQSNPTYFIEDSQGDRWVLRKQPSGTLLKGAHQIDREYRVMSALQDTDVPVPRVLLYCDDSEVLGTPFYVMSFVNGRVLEDVMLAEESAENRKLIYHSLSEVLAKLHRVDYKAVGLEGFAKPSGYIQRQLKTWGQQYKGGAAVVNDPKAWERVGLKFVDNGTAMDDLLAYLQKNVEKELSAVGTEPVGIVHGDYRLGNVILHPTEPRVVAVLDWELCTIGNPLADLSYLCMPWYAPFMAPGSSGQSVELSPGIPTEREFVSSYCQAMGVSEIPESLWNFMKAFQIFRSSAIGHGVFARGLQGNASSTKAIARGWSSLPAFKALKMLQANTSKL